MICEECGKQFLQIDVDEEVCPRCQLDALPPEDDEADDAWCDSPAVNVLGKLVACLWLPMFLVGLAMVLFFLVGGRAYPAEPAAKAVVRITSHGASGTIIYTVPGQTIILSCAHMFFDERGRISQTQLRKPLEIDIPAPWAENPQKPGIRLLAYDASMDLSLIEVKAGPMSVLCSVAPQAPQPGTALVSAGYDEMRWPATERVVRLLHSDERTTFTAQPPWHGRSGGALIDGQGYLVGVVQAYETDNHGRMTRSSRGIYASHQAICEFLGRQGWSVPHYPSLPSRDLFPPTVSQWREPVPPCRT